MKARLPLTLSEETSSQTRGGIVDEDLGMLGALSRDGMKRSEVDEDLGTPDVE